jgi:(R,R)-butanediol dehydrogenase/meso-butanediol dehydrogenase/diacetyl reductase
MKAAVVTGRRRFEIREIPTPKAQPGTVLLQVKLCAICGTDLEFVDNPQLDEKNKDGSPKFEAVLGHEWVGKVVEVGKGVTGWAVGDRAVDFRASCGQCYWCRHGLYHLCVGALADSKPFEGGIRTSMSGAMAEYILRFPQGLKSIMKVPDSVADEEAVLTEPLNVGLAPIYEAGIKAGDSVAILGMGHIGQLTLLAVKAAGAAPIIVTDRIKSRLDKALELGADYALNPDEGDVDQRIQNITEVGADVVIICARGADILQQSTIAVRREGTIAIVGFLKPALIDPVDLLNKHLKIIGCEPFLRYNVQALKLMEYKKVNCKPLISEIMPLQDVKKAFDSLYSGQNSLVMLKL